MAAGPTAMPAPAYLQHFHHMVKPHEIEKRVESTAVAAVSCRCHRP